MQGHAVDSVKALPGGANAVTVIDDDRRHHSLRRGRGATAASSAYAPGATIALHITCRADRYDIEIHRWGASRELVWSAADLAGQRTSNSRRRRCQWLRLARCRHGADRRALAQRPLPRHPHCARRACRSSASGTPRSSFAPRRPAPEPCWCWPPTPTTPTTVGAARACTPADGGCRLPDRSAEEC